jgi:transglutaminase-like putative cysteine protease
VNVGPIVDIDPAWLADTWFIDHHSDAIASYTERAARGASGPVETAVALFHAVRDGIRYDPYDVSYDREAYRASTIAISSSNWCVPKSVLLAACARHAGIPARLGFADVRNHLTSEKLTAKMGTDLFAWHGYAELLLPDAADGGRPRWFKLSTAFNIGLCERFGVQVLEFDGTTDALMHPFDVAGNRHMEYVRQRGSYDDLPLDEIFETFAEVYGDRFGRSAGDDAAGGGAAAAGDAAFGV